MLNCFHREQILSHCTMPYRLSRLASVRTVHSHGAPTKPGPSLSTAGDRTAATELSPPSRVAPVPPCHASTMLPPWAGARTGEVAIEIEMEPAIEILGIGIRLELELKFDVEFWLELNCIDLN